MVPGLISDQVQDLALPVVGLYEVPVCPILQPKSFRIAALVYWSVCQFCIVWKLAGGHSPIVQVINEDVKQC